jgi:hypothetical protein
MIEALASLGLASALIALLPFRSVARLAAGTAASGCPPASSAEAQWIACAIGAWAARVPWRAVCFQQGLAALLMLRRRRRTATLYYGAAHDAGAALVAHVWVKSADIAVIGCATAQDFGVLAVFPRRAD